MRIKSGHILTLRAQQWGWGGACVAALHPERQTAATQSSLKPELSN